MSWRDAPSRHPARLREALFVAMPNDPLWREHVLPVVSAYVEGELEGLS